MRSVIDGDGETLADFDAVPLLLGLREARGDDDGELEPIGDLERVEETDCETETRGDSVSPKTVGVASFVVIGEIVITAVIEGVESLECDAHEADADNEAIETVAELLGSVEILASDVSDAAVLAERVVNDDMDCETEGDSVGVIFADLEEEGESVENNEAEDVRVTVFVPVIVKRAVSNDDIDVVGVSVLTKVPDTVLETIGVTDE